MTVTLTHNGEEFNNAIGKIADRFGSAQPALEIIGETVTASVRRNFEKGGRPSGWQALSPVTLAKKKGGSILVGKGFAAGLLGSIHPEADETTVYIGTDKKYAAIHQLGGPAGRNHKVTIPARPFLMVQDEDVEEIHAELADYIIIGEV